VDVLLLGLAVAVTLAGIACLVTGARRLSRPRIPGQDQPGSGGALLAVGIVLTLVGLVFLLYAAAFVTSFTL